MKRFLLLLLFTVLSIVVQGQTTAFNYQGSLKDGGNPANGSYQMQFKLFDAASGGTQIGSTIADVTVTAAQGVFSVKLDFGAGALSGANRWLEIGVRRTFADPYSILSPREQIASTPYSVRTLSAATADSLSSSCIGCVQDANINSVSGTKVTGPVALATNADNATNSTNATNALNANTLGGLGASSFILKNGDTMTGTLNLPQNGLQISGNQFVMSSGDIGIGGPPALSVRFKVSTPTPGYVAVFGENVNSGGAAGIGVFGRSVNNPGQGTGGYFEGGSVGAVGRVNVDFVGQTIGVLGEVTGTSGIRYGIYGSAPNGVNKYGGYFDGGVGINGGPPWTTASWIGSLRLSNVGAIGWAPNSQGQSFGLGQTNTGMYFFRTADAVGQTNTPASYAMVIGNNGNIGVGLDTTLPEKRFHVNSTGPNSEILTTGNFAGYVFRDRLGSTPSDDWILYSVNGTARLYYAGQDRLSISPSGSLNVNTIRSGLAVGVGGASQQVCMENASGLFVACPSTIRYKSNIKPLESGLELALKLRPVSYEWLADRVPDIGFIAEEVEKIDPRLVTRNQEGEIVGVKYDHVSAVLVNAVKEQQDQIENLRKTVETQQKQIEALKKLLCVSNATAEICKEQE